MIKKPYVLVSIVLYLLKRRIRFHTKAQSTQSVGNQSLVLFAFTISCDSSLCEFFCKNFNVKKSAIPLPLLLAIIGSVVAVGVGVVFVVLRKKK